MYKVINTALSDLFERDDAVCLFHKKKHGYVLEVEYENLQSSTFLNFTKNNLDNFASFCKLFLLALEYTEKQEEELEND